MKVMEKRVLKVLLRFCVIIIVIILFWGVVNQGINFIEEKNTQHIGTYFNINDKKMNVYSVGNGDNTIVLMSGLGTTSPILDFQPLINELSKNNKVIVAESFGYGWSDLTDKERTVENIIKELMATFIFLLIYVFFIKLSL